MRNNEKVVLKDFDLDELKQYILSMGEPSFRSSQIFKWLNSGVESFDEMTNLSKDLRQKLTDNTELMTLELVDERRSRDETRKFLFKASDNEKIETVFMKYRYGNSICISSQAGCKMGCEFCASGLKGFSRNLTAAEMLDQILLAQNRTGEEIRHIVIMGIGEPFDNYENVKRFINIVTDENGLGISKRHITVSTCGLIPMIESFGRDFPQVNLAVSLHAPNDEVRNSLMPINSTYPMKELLQSVRDHIDKTGRRVTLEYSLIDGINDQPAQAKELAKILKGMNVHVNLIPLNPVKEVKLSSGKDAEVEKFKTILEENRIQVTVRRELGQDIDAACGQLRLDNDTETVV